MNILRLHRVISCVALLALFLCYAFLKRANLEFFTGDEGVYFYSGFLWSQGILPYRDFFISHPPVQLLVPTLTILLAGVHLPLLQLLPAFFGVISAILLLFLAWEALGALRAILAVSLYLLSYATLLSTLHYTGQDLALALLLGSFLLFLQRRKFFSGLLLGIAQGAGIHVLFPFAALTVLQYRWNPRALKNFVGGFLLSAGMIHLLFFALAGKNFLRMVYLYHLKKPDATPYLVSKIQVMSQMLEGHLFLVLLGLIGGFLFWKSFWGGEASAEKQRLHLLSAVLFLTYLLYLFLLSPIFPHYFAPLVPFMAIFAAEGLAALGSLLWRAWGTRAYAQALLGGALLGILLLWSAAKTLTFYGYEQRALAFESAPAIARRVEKELAPDETLFGDFGVVPTVALLSGRRIAAHQVDPSVMRFASGLYVLNDVIAAIEADHVKAVLTRKGKDIAYYPPFREYLKTHFRLVETYETPGRGTPVELWLKW